MENNNITKLHQLFDEYWQYGLANHPLHSTYIGDHRFDDQLDDYSVESYQKDIEAYKGFLKKLKELTSGLSEQLDSQDELNCSILERNLNLSIEAEKFNSHLMPISQIDGLHISFPQIIGYHPFFTVGDYYNYIKRLQKFSTAIDQTISTMQKGMELKMMPAKINIESTLPQISAHIVNNPEESIFYSPLKNFPQSFSDNEKNNITKDVKDAIENQIVPSYSKLLNFVRDVYLPACRDDIGVWALPNGEEYYRFLAKLYTTTNLTPEEIHEIGKRELEKIEKEKEIIKEKVGFKGSLADFNEYLRTDKRFYYTTGEELMQGFGAILKQMYEKLPQLFGRLPVIKCELKETEAYRAKSAPMGYYYSCPEDGSRPGYFYVNTYKPESRPKYTMEVLTYHEAVPGHHLQIAIAQELRHIPKFRRYNHTTAYIEGWALYSEVLGKEVGLYDDPFSDYGRLTFDAWRSSRLVIDTGIHYYRWKREDALEFMRIHTSLPEVDIVAEVDRYIANPGQALSYKIGQLKVGELREKAERLLGDKFDIKSFHDELLGDGAMPLDLLENKMNLWIKKEKDKIDKHKSARFDNELL